MKKKIKYFQNTNSALKWQFVIWNTTHRKLFNITQFIMTNSREIKMYGSLLPAIAECNLNLYFQILTAEAFFNCKIPVFQFQILLV